MKRFSRSMILAAILLASPSLAAAAPGASADRAAPLLKVTLTPAEKDADGDISYVDVTVTAGSADFAAGAPFLHMPLVSSNVKTSADSIENLQVSDAQGAVAVTSSDDAGADGAPFRHWRSGRAVSGALSIRYRVPITNEPNPLGAAPPFELRTEYGGFSGLGGAFLILPETDRPYRLAVDWRLGALGEAANGISTLGVGDVTLDEEGPADRLFDVFFMGGLIHHYPDPPPRKGFASSWQGDPPFDAKALMQWTEQLYKYDVKFFRSQGEPPYAVFLRRNLINPGGGVEVSRSFVGTFGEGTNVDSFKTTLAHEMVHTFVQSLDAPAGLLSSWYSEGLAVYYQRVLPWRAGLMSADAYLADLNKTAARYYTDIKNDTPNDEIPASFWADTRIRVLPYDRGSLYFAALDDELRKASHGERTLDDLVRAMLERRRQGQSLDNEAWISLVTEALGEKGRAEFERMMAGGLVLPASDAFGPCFTRIEVPLRRYELGFDSQVLIEPQRIVRGLVKGSAAARAGLRNGDAIVKPVPQDGVQADQTAKLTLLIRRNGREFPITYLPRGETVRAYQWTRVKDAGPDACAPR